MRKHRHGMLKKFNLETLQLSRMLLSLSRHSVSVSTGRICAAVPALN